MITPAECLRNTETNGVSVSHINSRFALEDVRTVVRIVKTFSLAVLVLQEKFLFTEFARPVCLPPTNVSNGSTSGGMWCKSATWDTNRKLMVHSSVFVRQCGNGYLCPDRNALFPLGSSLVCEVETNYEIKNVLFGIRCLARKDT